jgi:acyl-CoA synthetase (AMP-forming)/AMP-acid ligase II
MIVSTAGTTGTPKAVVHTHETLGAAVRAVQLLRAEAMGEPVRVAADGEELAQALDAAATAGALGLVYGTTMPLSTIAGITVALQALLGGERLVLTGSDPRGVLEAIDRSRITNISLSPALARLLVRVARRERRVDATTLLLAGIGSGSVPRELPAELERVLGCPAAIGYGMTETGGPITMGRVADAADIRHGTVGRPVPGTEVRTDTETGELMVRSPSLCAGYFLSGGVRDIRVDGWFRTGDRAVVRGDGAVALDGRVDALIIRGGRNIDPVVIEHALESHPAVARAAALAVPSPTSAGEHDIWSLVVLETPAGEHALRAHCYDRLGASYTPQHIVPVDTLPCAADGGIRRHELYAYVRRGLVPGGSRP